MRLLIQKWKPDYRFCTLCGFEITKYKTDTCSDEHEKKLKEIKDIMNKQKKVEKALGRGAEWNNITIHDFNKLQDLISDKG